MADEAPDASVYEVPYLRLFPWLRLFRCPGAASDPKKLMLAAVGLWLTGAGWGALDRAFPASSGITPEVVEAGRPIGPESLAVVPWWLTEPARLIPAPFVAAFDPPGEPGSFAHALLAALWAVAVWGLVGGAVARVAVVGLTSGGRVGLREALGFAVRKAVALVGTPLIPLLGVAVVAAPVAAFGLLYRLPGSLGATAAGLLGFLPLIGGLVLTLIVIGLAVGWPLMLASVAAEEEDGFDAMSRTYAYVHQRPWHYAGYVLLAFAVGCLGFAFVDVFARLVVHLTAWALRFAGPGAVVSELYRRDGSGAAGLGADAHRFWLTLIAWLVRSWTYSFFWTAATAIYLLLRRDVDGTPWGKIAYKPRPNPLFEAAPAPAAVNDPVPAPAVSPPHVAERQDAGEVTGVQHDAGP